VNICRAANVPSLRRLARADRVQQPDGVVGEPANRQVIPRRLHRAARVVTAVVRHDREAIGEPLGDAVNPPASIGPPGIISSTGPEPRTS
jgi:hypothetical protein